MFIHTRGIVLSRIRYSDSSIIVRVYSEESGVISFIIKGAYSKKAALKANVFEPLTLLDLVYSWREKSDLQFLKEAKVLASGHQPEITKNVVSVFVAELLSKTLSQEQPDRTLFQFVFGSLEQFFSTQEGTENFHLSFMFHLTSYLGFYAGGDELENLPSVATDNARTIKDLLQYLDEHPVELYSQLKFNRLERREIIHWLENYYRYHIAGFTHLRSTKILEEVIS